MAMDFLQVVFASFIGVTFGLIAGALILFLVMLPLSDKWELRKRRKEYERVRRKAEDLILESLEAQARSKEFPPY